MDENQASPEQEVHSENSDPICQNPNMTPNLGYGDKWVITLSEKSIRIRIPRTGCQWAFPWLRITQKRPRSSSMKHIYVHHNPLDQELPEQVEWTPKLQNKLTKETIPFPSQKITKGLPILFNNHIKKFRKRFFIPPEIKAFQLEVDC